MLNYLEQLLKEKTDKLGKKGELLYAQWQLDKEYATRVLATIFTIFPHYTLHDRTHSEEILTNIGEILQTETLKKFFSLTDLWLLLYAAFYHDMGMAVFAPDLDKILKSEAFFLYLKEIQADSKHHLHKEADYFEISDNKIVWKDSEVSLEKMEAFKFIVAEYIRSSHSKRSENTLKNDPSINPIPLRLRSILGKICKYHTESFETVMELPDKENGFDYEHCHPRFIACLLRLGDLLDLDNNRVSDIVLRTVKTIPAESFFHIQKHLSISHLKIDSKQIDITAECKGYKTADLASNWFSWLDKEITDQMKNWNQIVPNPDFGFLPTVGNLKVELKGYDSIDGKVHPKFEIDSQKAIEILQGAGIYSEPYQSIRELLQNSEDATYLRIWVENKDCNITREEFLEECRKDKYAIKVTMYGELSDDKNVWHITISDSGLGMSKEDLKFLYKTGSSSQNKEKQRCLSEMPEWMKPSGTFGIGFQSIFLLTDKVHIRTRKYNSGDEYDIDLYNPTGEDNGTILLKTIKNSNFKVGTEVSFDLIAKKIPEHINYYSNDEITESIVADYDFIKSEYLDFKIGKVTDAIIKFSSASCLAIKLNINDAEKDIDLEPEVKFQYYSKKTNLAVSINWKYSGNLSIFYRNQHLETVSPFSFHFLDISINILGGNVKEILTLNRNGINRQYSGKLYKDIISAVMECLQRDFSTMTDYQKYHASAFAYLYSDIVGIKNDNSEIFTMWKKYHITVKNTTEKEIDSTLGNLIEINQVKIIYEQSHHNYKSQFKLDKDCLLITTSRYYDHDSDKIELLYKAFSQYFQSFSYSGGNNVEYVLHKKEDLPLINENGWKSWFSNVYLIRYKSTARGLIPCNPEYIKLAIKDNCRIPSFVDNNTSYLVIDRFFSYPKMVSPYVIDRSENSEILKEDIPEKLIDFVFKNRKDETVTKEVIRAIYQQFVKDKKTIIDEVNDKNPSEENE